MIVIYDSALEKHPFSEYEDLCWVHETDGCDKLKFSVKPKAELLNLFVEEGNIDYGSNEWLIKKIQDTTVECELNFDFLKKTFHKLYRSETKSLSDVLRSVLPSDWKIENGNVTTIRRTIELEYCTDFDVVYQCMNTYSVYFTWKIKEKTVTVYAQDVMPSTDTYFTDELNLRSMSFQGDTTEFVTRLFCYGKDGLTFADINDGKEYVESSKYSNKVICASWVDERYTIAENLLADGQRKLDSLAFPVRSYECDVVNLAKLNPDYSFLTLAMHRKVFLLDRERKIKVEHQVVQYREYPEEPKRDVVTLSSVPGKIQTSVQKISSYVDEEIAKSRDSMTDEINKSTAMMNQKMESYTLKYNGEMFMADTDDINTATNIWRWNVNGLAHSSSGVDGPYSLAIRADGVIVADFIKAGTFDGSLIKANSITSEKIDVKNLFALSAKIGAWNISDKTIYQTIETDSGTYSVILANYDSNTDESRFLHCQKDGSDVIQMYRSGRVVFKDADNTKTKIEFVDGTQKFYYNGLLYGEITTTSSDDNKYWTMLAHSSNVSAISIGYASSSETPEYFMFRKAQYIDETRSYYHLFYRNIYAMNNVFTGGSLLLSKNNEALYGRQTDGSIVSLIKMSENNHLLIGQNGFTGAVSFFSTYGIYFRQPLLFNGIVGIRYDSDGTQTGMTGFHVGMSGKTTYLWGTVKLSSGTAVTSDRRLKNTIQVMDERYETLFSNLKPSTFKYNDGTSDRTHSGFIYQDVLSAVEKSGLTSQEFAALVSFESKKEGLDGYEYSLRYEEFIPINTFMIQKALKEISELKDQINQLQNERNTQS